MTSSKLCEILDLHYLPGGFRMYYQAAIKLDCLSEILKQKKMNKQEIEFIYEYLYPDNRERLKKLIEEDHLVIKTEKYKEDKKTYSLPSVLTVYNQPMLASEMVLSYAKLYKNCRIAILDIDRFNPTLDLYLNTSPRINTVFTHLETVRSTGINLLIDTLHKNKLTRQYVDHLSTKVKGYKNLHYFSGSYLIEDYEYFTLKDFKVIVEFLKNNYDLVMLSSNSFLYDAFTCYALMVSDLNIFGIRGQMAPIKETIKNMQFLEVKQHIPECKNYYLLFDYAKQHVKESLFKDLVNNYYLGNIKYSVTRHLSNVNTYLPTKRIASTQHRQYKKVIQKINMKGGTGIELG